jgi:hypothetical protein
MELVTVPVNRAPSACYIPEPAVVLLLVFGSVLPAEQTLAVVSAHGLALLELEFVLVSGSPLGPMTRFYLLFILTVTLLFFLGRPI